MRNVWLIFRQDASSLFCNVMSTIITVGLVVLPSLFAWYNILACWNVFDNTGNLSVAIASDDEGYVSDLLPVDINVGDRVVSDLRGSGQVNWVVTSSDDAIEGTKSGAYYAALVIPADFSRQMLTFYEGDGKSAPIRYYVNEKVNAISPNLTGASADQVSADVNSAFANTISEVAAALAKSFSERADEDDLTSKAALLSGRMRSLADRLDESSSVLGLYSSLASDSGELLKSSAQLVESAQSQVTEAMSSATAERQPLRELAARLSSAVDDLSSWTQRARSSFAEFGGEADSLLDGATADAQVVSASLRARAADLNGKAADLRVRLAQMEELRRELREALDREIDKIIEEGGEKEISEEIRKVIERTVVLDEGISSLSAAISVVEQAAADLEEAADALDAGETDLREKVDSLRSEIAAAQAQADAIEAELDSGLRPGIETLKGDLEALASDLEQVSSSLGTARRGLSDSAGGAADALSEASSKVEGARAKLSTAITSMRNLADSLDRALASGDIELVRSLLAGNASDLATALTAPVHVEREALFPVENFGSAMAPLYSTLALFIGSLLIMVAVRPEVSARVRDNLSNPKPRQLYFGRFGAVACLSLMQTTLLGLGNMFLLKVQVTEPVLYMVCVWAAGLVFAFMIYTLVVAFANLGKAIAVILLIVQVTGCGGSYPLPIFPGFVQTLSAWVPATYVVNAFRAAMFGVYHNDFWIAIGKLLLFVLPFLLLGLALRKPLEGFMRFYVSKVEESKLME